MYSAMQKQNKSRITVAAIKILGKARIQSQKLNKKNVMTVQYQAGSVRL